LTIFTRINGTTGRNGMTGTVEIIGVCAVNGGVEKVL